MELKYEMQGAERKKLVQGIELFTNQKAKYLGMPSMAYEVGEFRVSKEGTVTADSSEDLVKLEKELAEKTGILRKVEEASLASSIIVSFPKEKVNLEKLERIFHNKGSLIKKALGISTLKIEEDAEKVIFPWFQEIDETHLTTYTKFIAALCKMSMEYKRINDSVKEVSNEKYAFRCFLLRLGFIGEEFKVDRKLLLEKLSGSSAFRDGGVRDAISK